MSLDEFETALIRMNDATILEFLKYQNLIYSGMSCENCAASLELKAYKKVKDGLGWRCTNSCCTTYRKFTSIRKGSFFEGLNLSFLAVIKILIRWSCKQSQQTILNSMCIDTRTFKKVINKFLDIVALYDNHIEKLGGPGKIVQVDETGLNFKIKAHRGRAPNNKTDALCIVEFDNYITNAYSCVINDKKASTIIPIIQSHVKEGSIIWSDEHKSYSSLNSLGYVHDTVCHKYEFVNNETGANTQAVESYNNELNLEIKRRKGIKTEKRPEFLVEFNWIFNNKEITERFKKIWSLIRLRR